MKPLQVVAHRTPDRVGQTAIDIHGKIIGSLAPANTQLLDRYTLELHIVPKDKPLTSLPPFAHLKGKQSFESTPDRPRTWDEIRGSGGQLNGTVITFALSEEEITHDELSSGGSAQGWFPIYGTQFLQTHETGHIIHNFGLTPEQRTTVDQLYSARKSDPDATWLQPASYTSANAEEYFANSVAAFFGAPHSLGGDPDYSPEWLRTHDPKMFGLLATVFPGAPGATAPGATTPLPVPVPAPPPAPPPEWDTVRPDDIPEELRRDEPPPPPPAALPTFTRRRGCLVSLAIVIVLLLVAGSVLLFTGSGDDDGEGADGGSPNVVAPQSSAAPTGPVTTTMQFTQTVASVSNCPQGPPVGFDLSPKTTTDVVVDQAAHTVTVGTSNTVPYDPKTGETTITYADARSTTATLTIAPDGRVTKLVGTSSYPPYPGCTATLNTSAAPV